MSRVGANYRVVVYPLRGSRWISGVRTTLEQDRKTCEQIRTEINRHVDEVNFTETVCDVVCEFCGDQGDDPPICCDAAIEQWLREHPEWTLDADYNWVKGEGI